MDAGAQAHYDIAGNSVLRTLRSTVVVKFHKDGSVCTDSPDLHPIQHLLNYNRPRDAPTHLQITYVNSGFLCRTPQSSCATRVLRVAVNYEEPRRSST